MKKKKKKTRHKKRKSTQEGVQKVDEFEDDDPEVVDVARFAVSIAFAIDHFRRNVSPKTQKLSNVYVIVP
jgi:hypothetical protein